MMYVLIDIGCIECGEESDLVGIYSTRLKAEIAREYIFEYLKPRGGEHHYVIEECKNIDETKEYYQPPCNLIEEMKDERL